MLKLKSIYTVCFSLLLGMGISQAQASVDTDIVSKIENIGEQVGNNPLEADCSSGGHHHHHHNNNRRSHDVHGTVCITGVTEPVFNNFVYTFASDGRGFIVDSIVGQIVDVTPLAQALGLINGASSAVIFNVSATIRLTHPENSLPTVVFNILQNPNTGALPILRVSESTAVSNLSPNGFTLSSSNLIIGPNIPTIHNVLVAAVVNRCFSFIVEND